MRFTRIILKPTSRQQSFTNEELVTGIANNNNQVLDYLYHNNFHAVKLFVLKNSGDVADAHDIFQDAIVATWLNIRDGKFQALNGTPLGGYLYQVARNKWLDKVRSKQFRSTVRIVDEEVEYDLVTNTDHEEFRSERAQYLQSLYNQLGNKCKSILKGFYFNKKSLKEIGEELSYDAETLRTMKYRCMMKLRKLHQDTDKTSIRH